MPTPRDRDIVMLIEAGRLRVDSENGCVYAPKSRWPNRPMGAPTPKGYLRFGMAVGPRGGHQQYHFMVHRVVWVSVYGPLPEGYEVDHLDLVKTNNKISNLEAVPGIINMRRAIRAGVIFSVGRTDGIRDAKGRFGFKPIAGEAIQREDS